MQLDQQQLEIINSTESRIIVVAGAGSGKTSVLTERIRHLILDLGTRPADIVAITFTNKAADEMLSRMQDIPDIGDAFIGTIHSFANKILHAAGLYYQLLTDEMHVRLCHELISSYAKALTVERYDEFHLLVSQVKYGTVSKREVEEFFNYDEKEEYKAIYSLTPTSDPYFPETIPTICQARGIITFDDLLKYAKQYMLETNSTIKYCLVDEFQDVGNLEDRFITSLNAENYFLVGDDWQSIYKFKGANVDIFKARILDTDNWKTYYMTNNYRCAKSIIKLANSVIEDVESRIKKDIKPMRKENGTVIIKPKRQLHEWLKVIHDIGNFTDWFFLARTNADCAKLAEACKEHEIPYIMFKQGDQSNAETDYLMNQECVKILTVHSAKGLERKCVMLYGNFPVNTNKNAQKNYYFKRKPMVKTESQEEERRVMYVGVTRAQDHLLLLN